MNNFKLEEFTPETREELKGLIDLLQKAVPVGSFETSTGEFTDIDILALSGNIMFGIIHGRLIGQGWEQQGGYFQEGEAHNVGAIEDNRFTSYKKRLGPDGTFNFIITTDQVFYDNFLKAAMLCKHLNLVQKKDRVFIHEMILNGRKIKRNIKEL